MLFISKTTVQRLYYPGCNPLTHHCASYSLVDWSSLASRRIVHCCQFIYNSISGSLPSYLSAYVTQVAIVCGLRTSSHLVSHQFTQSSERRLSPLLPHHHGIQKDLQLSHLVSFTDCKRLTSDFVKSSLGTRF